MEVKKDKQDSAAASLFKCAQSNLAQSDVAKCGNEVVTCEHTASVPSRTPAGVFQAVDLLLKRNKFRTVLGSELRQAVTKGIQPHV